VRPSCGERGTACERRGRFRNEPSSSGFSCRGACCCCGVGEVSLRESELGADGAVCTCEKAERDADGSTAPGSSGTNPPYRECGCMSGLSFADTYVVVVALVLDGRSFHRMHGSDVALLPVVVVVVAVGDASVTNKPEGIIDANVGETCAARDAGQATVVVAKRRCAGESSGFKSAGASATDGGEEV
jgi:hypothetical protein